MSVRYDFELLNYRLASSSRLSSVLSKDEQKLISSMWETYQYIRSLRTSNMDPPARLALKEEINKFCAKQGIDTKCENYVKTTLFPFISETLSKMGITVSLDPVNYDTFTVPSRLTPDQERTLQEAIGTDLVFQFYERFPLG